MLSGTGTTRTFQILGGAIGDAFVARLISYDGPFEAVSNAPTGLSVTWSLKSPGGLPCFTLKSKSYVILFDFNLI